MSADDDALGRALLRFYVGLALGCLLGLLASAALAQMPEVKRTGGFTWVCEDPAGLVAPSNHNEWPAAIRECGRKAVEHGRTFRLVPGMVVEITPQSSPEPAPGPQPDPDPEPPSDPAGPISSFQVSATGIPEPWPGLAALDMQRERARLDVTVTPAAINDTGQRIVSGTNFGLWLWRNRVHGEVVQGGERQLFRFDADSTTPLPNAEAIAGEAMEVSLNWTPEGLGILVRGELRLYLEGAFESPAELVYGARTDGGNPFAGEIRVEIYPEPLPFDRCENAGAWATINGQPTPTPAECLVSTTLNWTAPTEYEDGTPIAPGELEAYRIYAGGALVIAVDAPEDQVTLVGQLPGTCYRATAIAKGAESDRSNETCR